MNWFLRLTGFSEGDYDETRRRLTVRDGFLYSQASSRAHGVGSLELVSLTELRDRVQRTDGEQRLRFNLLQADAGELHRRRENADAVFQVASQFNLLEMPGYDDTPEDGVSGYELDPTQGPACAIAAGAATIFRNYFVPVGGGVGQTRSRQIDGLHDIGLRLSALTGRPVADLWEMRNGYALCTRHGLVAIGNALTQLDADGMDDLRGRLRIGVHVDVEVTDEPEVPGQRVTQAFCSALPVSYRPIIPAALWEPFARLVLEAAYEATFLAARENQMRGGSDHLFLTRVGGSAFGNGPDWIDTAILRAVTLSRTFPLTVSLVTLDARKLKPLLTKVRAMGIPD